MGQFAVKQGGLYCFDEEAHQWCACRPAIWARPNFIPGPMSWTKLCGMAKLSCLFGTRHIAARDPHLYCAIEFEVIPDGSGPNDSVCAVDQRRAESRDTSPAKGRVVPDHVWESAAHHEPATEAAIAC
jgi:hypothetical protein